MRITCDPAKREWTLHERSLDMLRVHEVFAGPHFTRADDRHAYGEPRFITAGWLDSRLCRLRMDAPRCRKAHHQHEALP